MITLANLRPAVGSTKKVKRIGRGTGSGKGGTSTKGNKGAQSRSGYSAKRGFEGGQMPLKNRVPKWGFKNHFRVEYVGVNLSKIQEIVEAYPTDTINKQYLKDHGAISSSRKLVKVLGNGDFSSKVNIFADAFTKSALEKIEKAGSTAEILKK